MLPYISEKKINAVLNEKLSYNLAHETLLLSAKNKTVMPPKIYLTLPGEAGNDFRAMPAFLDKGKRSPCGLKWISVFPENRKLGIPTVNGIILLSSAQTGAPLAILEANAITAFRTAAVAAVASHYLARPESNTLAIVGAGLQAAYQLLAIHRLFRFKEIKVWGFTPKEAENFCKRFKKIKGLRPVSSVRECVAGADIIVTCTPSKRPLVQAEWIKKGAHVNAIGADAKGKEELDPHILKGAKVVVDDWAQASHSGEINVPVEHGIFARRNLYAELSEIVSGKKRGRTTPSEITIFDSTGLAIFDIYFARFVYDSLKLEN